MRKTTRLIAHAALIAAMYATLCHLQNILVPESASMAIQFRVAEALCVLACFTPTAIVGLTLGCALFNLTFAAALPMDADDLYTMEGAWLDDCTVLNYENGKTGSIYDLQKLSSDDLYEVFLSGSVSLLRIDNPNAGTDRELIVFRDSFGSSLVPLLSRDYKTVTVVDIRYLSSAMLDRFIDFHGQDVLFLYSTLVLNSSNQLQ